MNEYKLFNRYLTEYKMEEHEEKFDRSKKYL